MESSSATSRRIVPLPVTESTVTVNVLSSLSTTDPIAPLAVPVVVSAKTDASTPKTRSLKVTVKWTVGPSVGFGSSRTIELTLGVLILYVTMAAAHFAEVPSVPPAEYAAVECTTSYSGCMETKFVACPPVTLLWLSFVKPAPWVTAGFLSSIPNAPISSSSGCDVAAVLPEFGKVLLPVPVFN